MPFLPSIPEEGTTVDVFLAYRKMYTPFLDFAEEVFRGDGSLSPKDRELIFAYVSNLNACAYCFGGHSASAFAYGFAEDVFERLADNIDTAPVDDRLKPLLRYVHKLNETPNRMVQADADAVYAAGWDEEALHGAITLCCMANFMNRLVDGCGLAADPALFGPRGRMANEMGYRAPFYKKLGL